MTNPNPPRLDANHLPSLDQKDIRTPSYERRTLTPGVVHLGLGAFQRAHQALVFDDLLQAGDERWGVLGVASRSWELADTLSAQDGLYSIKIQSAGRKEWRVVGSVLTTCAATRERQQVLDAIAHSATRWITLTVTEKGYDASLAALLLAGLQQRQAAGLGGLTIACCDNLRSNGDSLKALCLKHATDPALSDWISRTCAFPNSMVDRIAPASTAEDRSDAAEKLGVSDQAALRTETFWQWVLEDRFVDPSDAEALKRAGVTVVPDVRPYEDAKLRMLNGTHSALATLGLLLDLPVVGECIVQPQVHAFAHRLMTQEVMPHLALPNLADYRDALLARFGNPTLQHAVQQVATDGSKKIGERWVPSVQAQLDLGHTIEHHALATALWIWSCRGESDQGKAYALNDPQGELLHQLARKHQGSPVDMMDAFLKLESIWGSSLPHNQRWRSAVERWLQVVSTEGTNGALALLLATPAEPYT
jgi:fructuronate reductase